MKRATALSGSATGLILGVAVAILSGCSADFSGGTGRERFSDGHKKASGVGPDGAYCLTLCEETLAEGKPDAGDAEGSIDSNDDKTGDGVGPSSDRSNGGIDSNDDKSNSDGVGPGSSDDDNAAADSLGGDDDNAGAEDSCYLLEENNCKQAVTGLPVDLDVCAFVKSGAATDKSKNKVKGKKNVFVVFDKPYLDLDEAQRNVPFRTDQYELTVDKKSCEASANLLLTGDPDTRIGCFVGDTRIRLAGGVDKLAKDIVRGDMVFNPLTGASVAITSIVKGPETEGLIDVSTKSGTVTVSPTHPFLTKAGVKQAQELTIVDALITTFGSFEAVSKVIRRPAGPNTLVYNFKLGDDGSVTDHMVLANGVVAGDLTLQERTEKDRARSRSIMAVFGHSNMSR